MTHIRTQDEGFSKERQMLLYGRRIVVNKFLPPPSAVLQVSPSFTDCSEECRKEMNAWLLEMFGTQETSYKIGDTVFVSPHLFDMLRKSCSLTTFQV
jgi:hypothetical protein